MLADWRDCSANPKPRPSIPVLQRTLSPKRSLEAASHTRSGADTNSDLTPLGQQLQPWRPTPGLPRHEEATNPPACSPCPAPTARSEIIEPREFSSAALPRHRALQFGRLNGAKRWGDGGTPLRPHPPKEHRLPQPNQPQTCRESRIL